MDEPTWKCHHNPLVGALGIQEPVILGEPQIKGKPMIVWLSQEVLDSIGGDVICFTAYNSRNKTQAPDHFLSNG